MSYLDNLDGGVNQPAVEDDTNIQIAPELMGEHGLPPTEQSRRSPNQPDTSSLNPSDNNGNGPSEGYPGFASSNARGGDDDGTQGHGHVDVTSQWDPSVYGAGLKDQGLPPWANADYTYSDAPALGEVDTTLASATEVKDNAGPGGDTDTEGKPKKRPRPSKPRQSKIDKEPLVDINDMIFENNDQDIKSGPVFVHSPAGTAQACIRCHRIKRKCDQARPRCQGCNKADVACVYELSPATSFTLKGDNAILSTQIASAHDRIAQLEALVANLERNGNQSSYPSMDESYDRQFEEIAASQAGVTDFSALARTILAGRSDLPPTTGPNTTPYPSYDLALEAVAHFFETYHSFYPFLERAQVDKDTENLYARLNDPEYLSAHEDDQTRKSKEFVLFLIVSLGMVEGEKTGVAEKGSVKAYREKALTGLSSALTKEDLSAVEALTILAIYTLVVPCDISPFQVLGYALQLSFSLNLHMDGESSKIHGVRGRKTFVSLCNLERLVSSVFHRPAQTAVYNIGEVANPSDFETSRRVQDLRQWMGKVSSLFTAASPASSYTVRDAVVDGIAQAKSLSDSNSSGDLYFKLQYHQTNIRVYLPRPLLPVVGSEAITKIYESGCIVIDILRERWSGQNTPYTVVSIYDQLHSLVAVLYSLAAFASRSNMADPEWLEEVKYRLGQIHILYSIIAPIIPSNKVTQAYDTLFGYIKEKYLIRLDNGILSGLVRLNQGQNVKVPEIDIEKQSDEKVEKAVQSLWLASDGKVNVNAFEALNNGLKVDQGARGYWNGL